MTPVAVFLFNRPEETARVLEAVNRAQPPLLLVIADGARPSRPGEIERCRATRSQVQRFKWRCEIRCNFSEGNLGCRKRLSSGLDWVFAQVPEAVILEDDCLPDPSFFDYCEILLDRYRDDDRVMHIGGNNFGLDSALFGANSYQFGSFAQVWGWASWRRAWNHYDVAMRDWPHFRDAGKMHQLPLLRRHRLAQLRRWNDVHEGRVDTWDFQWHFALLRRHGLAAIPRLNLVSNIGFSAGATHTTDATSDKADLPHYRLPMPLVHPGCVEPSDWLDRHFADKMLGVALHRRVLDLALRKAFRLRRS